MWGAFPPAEEPRGVWAESETRVSAPPMQTQSNPECSGAPLGMQWSKMQLILCLTRAALCVKPASSLLSPDRDAMGQNSDLASSPAAVRSRCCSLPPLPWPAQHRHRPSHWLQGSPVLPGTACRPAHGGSVQLQLVLSAQARTQLPP